MKDNSITRVQARGQVTLPKEIRELARIDPGDLVKFSVTASGGIEIQPVRIKPLEYFWEKFSMTEPYVEEAIRQEAEDIAAREAMGE